MFYLFPLFRVLLPIVIGIRSARKFFEVADLAGTLLALERHSDREFLKMNLQSVLRVRDGCSARLRAEV